jgi:DNA-binding response OmpR family regulator
LKSPGRIHSTCSYWTFGLPDVPGDEVLREVRSISDGPILVLTARSSEDERIHGLELGADDYVTKPFSPREIGLRAEAIVRRGRNGDAAGRPASFGQGALTIDESLRQVTVRGSVIELTPTEWGILDALAATPGRVLSRFELINRVRGYDAALRASLVATVRAFRARVLLRSTEWENGRAAAWRVSDP